MKSNLYRLFAVALSVVLGATLTATAVSAATTISTNIQTDGTLSVTGASTLGVASTTLLSALGPAYFGATATSTFDTAGNLSLVANGLIVGTTQLVVSGGNVAIGTTTPADNLTVSNPASTATLGVISDGNSEGSGNVRFDLINGDNNKYSLQFAGSANTALKLQYDTATEDTFGNNGSLALGQTGGAVSGSMLTVAGVEYMAS